MEINLLLTTPLWRQTPPAIFPVCLGFMSLALAWRNAADIIPFVPPVFGDLLLGLSTGYFVWFLMFYFAKVAARPGVVMDDLQTPPARAGMAAAAMSMMILAAALLRLNVQAPLVWWTGVLMQIFASAVVLLAIWRDPPNKRQFSTFQYLTFVGPVAGPIAGIPLGYVWESIALTFAALVAWVIVTVGIAVNFRRNPLPDRLRPSVMINLAPLGLFALSFGGLGYESLFLLFFWACNIVSIALIILVPWMIKGGYTPVWAAFTFPLAVFANVQVLALGMGYGLIAEVGVYLSLGLATPVILLLSYVSIMQWVTGDLTKKSNGAIA